ncbi:HipA N-terminal domain-containing protein [Flammeovirga kamogawensis]|uniref:HipA N-terminal domain-containing protein n=1 Tax=Flammeovirga kamogawensis TaxID=373891 RepID=A0ABX8H4H2_9BACT|nr:HipA N-terminal domain-containing protein [Flammeovirga kamogawensis]MBB6463872.1 serine/threonine-protein kinase HipA [Flammeovirga kamogawensis]QWG10794.1 HipA N-terminal domain-containing protein [Flammeovirga kamogawensis]TRX63219.1 phosphatidylinositol kinase [Flammeovirga kamogawensis]
MRQARVTYKGEEAGLLTQLDNGSFIFRYYDTWFNTSDKPAISLTLPKVKQEYRANFLFPFFYNMLPEGTNKEVVCYAMRIDKTDYFGLLLNTASNDTIGAVRVMKINTK